MTKNSRKSADVVPKVYKNAQMWGGARRRAPQAASPCGKRGLTRREKEGIIAFVTNCNLFNVL